MFIFVFMKTTLSTPTSELTTPYLRKIVGETIKWCEKNLGKKRYKITYRVRTLGDVQYPQHARYNYGIRTMTVFRDHCRDVKMVICSVLHEYTHYLQNLRWYENVLYKVGYENHPQEIEARKMENRYNECWKQIKLINI